MPVDQDEQRNQTMLVEMRGHEAVQSTKREVLVSVCNFPRLRDREAQKAVSLRVISGASTEEPLKETGTLGVVKLSGRPLERCRVQLVHAVLALQAQPVVIIKISC